MATPIYNDGNLMNFVLDKASSPEYLILLGQDIHTIPLNDLTKMTNWFSYIAKDMAKSLCDAGAKLNDSQSGLYFQYCIDKAVEIVDLYLRQEDWLDISYCPSDAFDYWEPLTSTDIQQSLTAIVPKICMLHKDIESELLLHKEQIEQNELHMPGDMYKLVLLGVAGSILGLKWRLKQDF